MGWDKIKSLFNRSAAEPTWKDARRDFFKALVRQDTARLTAIAEKYPNEAFSWDKGHGTALYMAMRHRKFKSFQHLVAIGAKMDNGLLTEAAHKGKSKYVEFMLERASFSTSNAIVYATVYNHHEIADMLKRADKIRAEYQARERALKEKTATTADVKSAADDGQIRIEIKVTPPSTRR